MRHELQVNTIIYMHKDKIFMFIIFNLYMYYVYRMHFSVQCFQG